MKNPVEELREMIGLSRREFAQWCGVSETLVGIAELGYRQKLPPSIVKALRRVGVDIVTMEQKYAAWLLERRKEQDERVRAAIDRMAAAL